MKKIIILLLSSILFYSTGLAQNPGWIIYNKSGSLKYFGISSLAIDQEDVKWIGNSQGLFRFDGVNWKLYNKDNSGLPDNDVLALDIDSEGNLWIGTETALSKFDGENWTVYTDEFFGLTAYNFNIIEVDTEGTVWFGCSFSEYTSYKDTGGLVRFDGENITVYNMENSELPWCDIHDLDIDNEGNIWISTVKGLARFDGTDWLVYNEMNSPLNVGLNVFEIDTVGTIWIATERCGLLKLDGEQWIAYT